MKDHVYVAFVSVVEETLEAALRKVPTEYEKATGWWLREEDDWHLDIQLASIQIENKAAFNTYYFNVRRIK